LISGASPLDQHIALDLGELLLHHANRVGGAQTGLLQDALGTRADVRLDLVIQMAGDNINGVRLQGLDRG
jgi:hypothetical protein